MYQIVTILSILVNLICLLVGCPSGNILWQLEINICIKKTLICLTVSGGFKGLFTSKEEDI